MRRLFVITLFMLSLLPLAAAAQDEPAVSAAVPVHYNREAGFGMPLPPDWENLTQGAISHLQRGTDTIYVLQIPTTDAAAAIPQALRLLNADFNDAPFNEGEANVQNGAWLQQVYRTADASLSVFAQVYDERAFVLVHQRPATPGTDEYNIIVSGNDPLAGIQAAGERILGPGLTPEADATFPAQDAEGRPTARAVFTLADGAPAAAHAEVRGGNTFVTLVRGADAVEPSTSFYDVLLGFFATPDTRSYLLLGLAVTALVMALFIASLVARQRSLRADMRTLDELG